MSRRFPTGCPEVGLSIRIGDTDAKGGLGYFDPAKMEIVISPNQPHVAKHVILIHELLHAVDDALVSTGLTTRRASHNWIKNAAPNLLTLLVTAGLYRGVDKDELLNFVTELK